MIKQLLKNTYLYIVVFLFSFTLSGQNVILNNDFEASGGSLNDWQYTSGTTLKIEGTDHYASVVGENGVLYQKITNISPGLPYVCTINFKSLVLKQTTGYGFAIEKGAPLTIPTFTIGATNLRDFCNNNNGLWTQLDTATGTTESDGSVTYSYNITIPSDATAIYICLGTKGAVAKLDVNNVAFQKDPNIKEVKFQINDTSNNPVQNAEIQIQGFSFSLLTNALGQAVTNLILNTNYNVSVLKDYFIINNSLLTITPSTSTVVIQLEDLVEIKDVQTRISEYGDNLTPYPIYAHMWNGGLNFSAAINQKLTDNFDYIIGGGDINNMQANVVDALKALDDKFQVIQYQGGWSQKASLLNNEKMNLLYYRAGTLSSAIDASQTTFVINAPSDNKGLGLVASETNNFTTWIRIGGELMKLVSVSSKTAYPITVTVERGFESTTPISHTAISTVTAPVYTVIPIEGGNNSNLSYFDPVFGPRKNRLKQNAIDNARFNNKDGIWIDILVGLLDAKSMTGGNYTLWNHDKNQVLSSSDINLKTKDAMNEIYNGFYARLGYYPVIYGNNVLYDQNYNSGSRAFVMEKTIEHPRGLDGFCHENSWGHMSDDSGGIDNDGNPVSTNDIYRVVSKYNNGRFLEWYMGNTWIDRCKTIALLAQRELPNQPMTINAGFKNQWFAYDLTRQQRYDFNKYSYASYLLSVEVDNNNKISTRMGISPMTDDGSGNLDVVVESFFLYDIGIPTETNSYSNFTNYRVGSNNLYARQFSKGLVLINPFNAGMSQSVSISTITGTNDIYLNPEEGNNPVTTVQLGSREALLLLKDNTASVEDNTKNAVSVFPNPANTHLQIKSKLLNQFTSKIVHVELCNLLGQSKRMQAKSFNGLLNLNVSTLSPGMYIIKIKDLNFTSKFIKQ